jgi:hypothetical protein
MHQFWQKKGWATFWAFFSQARQVTLPGCDYDTRPNPSLRIGIGQRAKVFRLLGISKGWCKLLVRGMFMKLFRREIDQLWNSFERRQLFVFKTVSEISRSEKRRQICFLSELEKVYSIVSEVKKEVVKGKQFLRIVPTFSGGARNLRLISSLNLKTKQLLLNSKMLGWKSSRDPLYNNKSTKNPIRSW